MSCFQERISEAVKAWIAREGLTHKQMAGMIGISQPAFSLRLSNHRYWRISELDKLAALEIENLPVIKERKK